MEGEYAVPVAAWQVHPDADDTAAYAALATDRLWAGYSIADLEPPFRTYSTFSLATLGAGPPLAACLFLRHPAFTATIPHGEPAGVSAILAASELPDDTYLLARDEHWPVLMRWFDFPHRWQAMCRLALDAASFRPLPRRPELARLGPDALVPLQALYADYSASAFTDDQLTTGVFYGVYDPAQPGRLLAAGGTHLVAPRYGIAAVGNLYTRPEARGRGYASAITSAVVADLLAGSCRDVILNVAADNTGARRVYERLGFYEHCRYREARATRREQVPGPS